MTSLSGYVRDRFMAFATERTLIEKMLTHMVNNRVQEFQDPLTSTLVLMATSPMQMSLCEAGLLPFKTNLLPVVPYSLLTASERRCLHEIISHVPDGQVHETIESSGQYTLTVLPFTQNLGSSSTITLMCKKTLLNAAVGAIMKGNDPLVGRSLSNIVLQRFMAQVPTPSDIAGQIMAALNPREVCDAPAITASSRKRASSAEADSEAEAGSDAEASADAEEGNEEAEEEAMEEEAEEEAMEEEESMAPPPPCPKINNKKKPKILPSIYN